MLKWMTRLLLWPIALICVLVVAAFFLLQQDFAQQYIIRHALEIVNRDFVGSMHVEHVSVSLNGSVQVRGFVLRDEADVTILTADRVQVRLAPWDLLRGRVHVLQADLHGLRGSFVMNNGEINIARAFEPAHPVADDTSATPASAWVRLDRLSFTLDSLAVSVDSSFAKVFSDHRVIGDALITDSVITYDLTVAVTNAFELQSAGVVRHYSDSLLSTDIHFTGSSQYVKSNWSPEFPDIGKLSVTSRVLVEPSRITSVFDIASEILGELRGEIEIDDYADTPSVSLGASFRDIDLSAWIGDSIAHQFSGRASLTKSKSPEWTNDWSGRIELDNSYWDHIKLDADVEAELFAQAATLSGEIRTNAGSINLSVRSEGLSPDSLSLSGHATLKDATLHAFVPEIPDSLSPLSGTAEFSYHSYPHKEHAAEARVQLGAVSLGRYKLDSLTFAATLDGTTFTLDSTRIKMGSASAWLFARGDYTQHIASEISADIPYIEELRGLITPYFPHVDSLSGDVSLELATLLTLAQDSLSDVSLKGKLKSKQLTFGEITAHTIEVQIDTVALSTEQMEAELTCDSLVIAEETITPITLSLSGSWMSPEFACFFAARGDTLEVDASGTLDVSREPHSVEIMQLALNLFGTQWRNDFPVVVSFDSLHYEIEALILRSDYGVLRATGYLENPGQQDLVVEFSGLETGRLAPILRMELPDGDLNLRLQLSGSDSAMTGDFEVVLDSVSYMKSALADRMKFSASLDATGKLFADAIYVWFADTVLSAHADIPATFSMQKGFVISKDEQLAGALRVDSLPIGRFKPWMSAGTQLDGFFTTDLALQGTIQRPDWRGDLELDDGFYRDSRYGIAYKWIVLDADLRRDSLVIHTFRATSRGTITGTGFARLGVPWPEELDLKLHFDKFEAVSSRRQKARLDGEVTLSGPFNSLNAEGKLTIQEGLYRLTQAATKTIEHVDLDSVLAGLRGDTLAKGFDSDKFYRSMSHDLVISIPGNFWIRGAGLNIELAGELRLEKDHRLEPSANGEITIRNGTVKFYGQELRIEDNSSLRFDGPPTTPELNISAIYKGVERERGYEVTVKLTGTPDKSAAEFSGRFDDGSVMSEDEAIQRLLPFASTGDGSGFSAEQSVVDAASGQVSDIVSKASGLDVFEFRPGPGGLSDLSSGQLELGTYVTDRLFVRVFQPIEDPRSGQKVSIDYRLLDWMKITAEQESQGQSSTSSSFTVYLQFEWR